ncbi:Proline iminopeptidase [Luteitalea pratensis]|uniref:Proline iminopeptidase n=1 Tax=Luteitalea pratensis TaxID=1855912 RepID=A0A143PHI5_LUTPR|nr:alpha/beta hydrolase [Luteitalea pratensis]AMY07740.1 Proline iminopeptidase [Luteitalea pratensis]
MTRHVTLLLLAALLLAPGVALAQQDSTFVSDGVELHYRSAGTGTPAVLLSGGPGFRVDYMIPVGDFLPAGYRRIFLEQRGTGKSRPAVFDPAGLTLQMVVEDLEALRLHLKQDRLLLVGHSWGGMLAMAYAATHPDRVDRLVLIGSGGPTLEFTQWFNDNIEMRLRPEDSEARNYWQAAAKKGVDGDKAAMEAVRAILPGYFFDRKQSLAFAAAIQDGALHPDVNAGLFGDLAKQYDLRDGLRKLNRQVLIVQGHQDPIGDKTAEDIHALIAGSTLTYFNKAGHFPWIEQPEEFRRVVGAFLGRQ